MTLPFPLARVLLLDVTHRIHPLTVHCHGVTSLNSGLQTAPPDTAIPPLKPTPAVGASQARFCARLSFQTLLHLRVARYGATIHIHISHFTSLLADAPQTVITGPMLSNLSRAPSGSPHAPQLVTDHSDESLLAISGRQTSATSRQQLSAGAFRRRLSVCGHERHTATAAAAITIKLLLLVCQQDAAKCVRVAGPCHCIGRNDGRAAG